MADETPVPPSAAPQGEDNTIAIVSYLFGIGFIIALVMHGSNKTKLGAFHLRQALGLILAGIVLSVGFAILAIPLYYIPFVGWAAIQLLRFALGIGLLGLTIMGILAASGREMKPLPVVGPLFQKWFGTAFD